MEESAGAEAADGHLTGEVVEVLGRVLSLTDVVALACSSPPFAQQTALLAPTMRDVRSRAYCRSSFLILPVHRHLSWY